MLILKSSLQVRLLLVPLLSCSYSRRCTCIPLVLFIQNRAYTSAQPPSSKRFLLDYLTNSLNFPKSKAVAVNSRFPNSSSEKPKAVVRFFKTLGLSETQIQSATQRQPLPLFLDVEKTLKPKVTFLQELGLSGPQLAMIISKNPTILVYNLDKRLKPSIRVIKEALELDRTQSSKNNINIIDVMFHILSRNLWGIAKDSRLRSNITYVRSCGVVGSQLIMLLKYEITLFSLPEEEFKLLISQAKEMGFVMGSRMLAYSNSDDTVNRKFELLQSFGFSRDECKALFVRLPMVLKLSEEKIRRGIMFFMHTAMLEKSAIIGSPCILTFSMEKRVIPRYKILEMIKSRSLLNKDPSFTAALTLSNKKFVEKYILKFADDAEILQIAYEKLLESSEG